jgi:hypothetical protein
LRTLADAVLNVLPHPHGSMGFTAVGFALFGVTFVVRCRQCKCCLLHLLMRLRCSFASAGRAGAEARAVRRRGARCGGTASPQGRMRR